MSCSLDVRSMIFVLSVDGVLIRVVGGGVGSVGGGASINTGIYSGSSECGELARTMRLFNG